MFCEECGAKIDNSGDFCSECGEECNNSEMLIEQNSNSGEFQREVQEPHHVLDQPKKKNKMPIIIIMIILSIVGVGSYYFYHQHQQKLEEAEELKKEQEAKEEAEKIQEQQEEEQFELVANEDLQSYVGEWQEGVEDVYLKGGAVLLIEEIEDDLMTFQVIQVSSSQKVAETKMLTAPIIDNSVEFTYEDSFENSGKGTLILKEDGITAILTETSNSGQNHSVAMNVKLQKNSEDRYGEFHVEAPTVSMGTPPAIGTYIQGSTAPYIVISNVTDNTFDFEIFDGSGNTMFKHHTAEIKGNGMAVYDGENYYLTFEYEGMSLEVYGFDLIGNPGYFELVNDYAS